MNTELKEKFPQHCEDKDTNFSLLLSDDIDSFMCYILQKELFSRDIVYFYDVNYEKINGKYGKQMLYGTQDIEWNMVLGLDTALEHEVKCWDNHVTRVSRNDKANSNSANMNNGICQQNYTDKFIVSSFITMLSYYEIDISKWDKDQLSVLCAIDGVYTPFIGSSFKAKGRKNLSILGYEFLADFIEENVAYIMKLENQLNLKFGKIKIEDGFMKTNIDLLGLELIFSDIFKTSFSLPNLQFVELESYKSCHVNFGGKNSEYNKGILNVKDRLVNFVLTRKNKGIVSYNMS